MLLVGLVGVLVAIVVAGILLSRPLYPQATGNFPQVVSCVQENPDPQSSDNWRPH